jgi:hypothetical protein
MPDNAPFFVAVHPSRADLLAYRYALFTYDPTCTTYASIADPTMERSEYPPSTTAPSASLR